MERESSQLRQREQQEGVQLNHTGQTGREFASVDEMLRYDATQTEVPTGIAIRLQNSISGDPKQTRSFWQRLRFWKS
jgi:hypothetical protein